MICTALEVLVGVLGGASVSGASGALIKEQLTKLLKNMGSLKADVRVSSESLKTIKAQIQEAVNKSTKNIKISANTDTGSSLSSNKSARVSEATRIKKVNALYQEQRNIIKSIYSLEDSINRGSLKSTELKNTQAALDAQKKRLTTVNAQISANSKFISTQKREAVVLNNNIKLVQARASVESKRAAKQITQTERESAALTRQLGVIQQAKTALESGWYTDTAQIGRIYDSGQLDLYKQKVAEVQNSVAALFDSKGNLVTGYQQNLSQVVQKVQDLDKYLGLAKRQSDSLKAPVNLATTWDKLANKAYAYYLQIERIVQRNPQLAGELNDLVTRFRTGGQGFANTQEGVLAFNELQLRIRDAGLEVESFGQKVQRVFSEKFGYGVMAISALYLRRAMAGVYQSVVDIDTAMVELRKVTDETNATYNRFLDNAIARAKKFGATVSDIINTSADWARLGYSISDSELLGNASTVLLNVGDDIDDISTATENLISTMRGFGYEVEEVFSVIDKLNEVSNNMPISAGGISEALKRSSAAMSEAGNTLEQTIGLIVAANSVVQDPDKVGTALKTTSLRIRGAKAELEEAELDVDGMASSVSELREELLALTGQKVDIQIDEDTFKSTYEILVDLSKVWDSLTDINRAAILEDIAGKRQANIVAAIIKNITLAEESVEIAADSAGSALEENAKYLDSISGRISILKAQGQAFSESFLNTQAVKNTVSTLTALLTVLTDITNTLGSMGTIGAGLGVFGLLKSVGGPKVIGLFINVPTNALVVTRNELAA